MPKEKKKSKFKSIVRFLYDISNYFGDRFAIHDVGAYSAQAAFYIILSFFPFIMLLTAILNAFPFVQVEMNFMDSDFLPSAFSEFLAGIISEIPSMSSGTLISITAITALWSASRGMNSLVSGLNSVYEVKEKRNFIHVRLLSLLYTFLFLTVIVIILVLLVFGNTLYDWLNTTFPNISRITFVIISFRFVFSLFILTLFFSLIYRFFPNRKSKVLYEFPGATLAALGWIGFSYLYGLYVNNANTVTSFYGSLTTAVFMMLWLLSCMYILFFGAEFNALLYNNKLFINYKKRKAEKNANIQSKK